MLNELEFFDDKFFDTLEKINEKLKKINPNDLVKINQNPNMKLSELSDIAKVDISTRYVGYNLSGADLSNDNLDNFNFSEADLSNTNLKGTSLRNAKLIKTNLRGADLTGADLTGATTNKVIATNTKLTDTVCYTLEVQNEFRIMAEKFTEDKELQKILIHILSPHTDWARNTRKVASLYKEKEPTTRSSISRYIHIVNTDLPQEKFFGGEVIIYKLYLLSKDLESLNRPSKGESEIRSDPERATPVTKNKSEGKQNNKPKDCKKYSDRIKENRQLTRA